MNRLIKFAIGLLVARAIGRAKGWLKDGSPLARGAESMAKRGGSLRNLKDHAPKTVSPAKGAGWV